jgi:hypothetical protein
LRKEKYQFFGPNLIKVFFIKKMKNQSILISIILAAVGAAAIYISQKGNLKEGFWMTPSRTWKVDKEFRVPGGQDFFSTPNFQSILSPRFSNVNYGPNLRTQFPSYARMGVPFDPLSEEPTRPILNYDSPQIKPPPIPTIPTIPYKTMENFSETTNPGFTSNPIVTQSISNGTAAGWQETQHLGPHRIPLDPHNPYSAAYANGNFNEVVTKVTEAGATGWPTSKVQTLDTATFMSPSGEMKQPIVYDRFIYANRNSRLRGMGDPIRGDLPIVPITGNWFVPSGAFEGPNVVLQQGAMNVMGGVNNETNNQLANLIYNSSGGAETAIGGVDMANTNMSHTVYGAAAAAQGDIQISAFP